MKAMSPQGDGHGDPRFWRSRWSSGVRVLYVSLDGEARRRAADLEALLAEQVELGGVAARGGPAVALAAFVAAKRARAGSGTLQPPSFGITVGQAVQRGLPTAARASLSAPTVLRGGLVEASFGGGFARALCAHTDAVLVWGLAQDHGGGNKDDRWVLALDPHGGASLAPAAFPRDCDAPDRAAGLISGGDSALVVGPAAELGLPFAHLGSWTAPGTAPSLVGRGGVGHAVAASGFVAVRVAPALGSAPGAEAHGSALFQALIASPRLLARASDGTLELSGSRGDAPDSLASSLRAEQGFTKHGCVGCPTPCGWQFDRPGRRGSVGGRFAALQGFLGGSLTDGSKGEGSGPEALALVERCNRIGLDARSTARFFQLQDVQALAQGLEPEEAIDQLVHAGSDLHARALRFSQGEDQEPAPTSHAADLAAAVGRRLSARGPEPLRSLSVLGLEAVSTGAAEVRRRLEKDLHLVGMGDDVEVNAGVIAHWQECFSAAIDQYGFCAFSAAGLIADRVLSLHALAAELERGEGAGTLLGLGAKLVELHLELAEGDKAQGGAELPAAAIQGMRDARARGWLGDPEAMAASHEEPVQVGGADAEDRGPQGGEVFFVQVLVKGTLARRLRSFPGAVETGDGSSLSLPMELSAYSSDHPPRAQDVVHELALAVPSASSWLETAGGQPLPAVLIAGQSLPHGNPVAAGATLELLLVIPGG